MGQFRFLTGGESHGKGLVAIVEGMVADLPLEERHINEELRRRQQGYGRGPRMKIEDDKAEIIARGCCCDPQGPRRPAGHGFTFLSVGAFSQSYAKASPANAWSALAGLKAMV